MESRKFREELQHLIHCHSQENGSNTPDLILAEYLDDCLRSFDRAVIRREEFYGRRAYPQVIEAKPATESTDDGR